MDSCTAVVESLTLILNICCLFSLSRSHSLLPTYCKRREVLFLFNTLNKTFTQSVGLPWTRDRFVAEIPTDNTQHSHETDIHATVEIQTRNPWKRTAADPRLAQRGQKLPSQNCVKRLLVRHVSVCVSVRPTVSVHPQVSTRLPIDGF
jgi:hypothetical protein